MSTTTRTRTGMTGLALAFATGAALLLSGCGTTDDTSTPAAVSVPGVAPAGSEVPLSPPPLPQVTTATTTWTTATTTWTTATTTWTTTWTTDTPEDHDLGAFLSASRAGDAPKS